MPGVPSLIIKFTFPLSFSFFWRLSHPSVVLYYYLLSNQIELIPCCSQHIVVVDSWCRATCYCTNISWLSWPHPSPQNETRWNKPLETTNKEQICLPTDTIKRKKKKTYMLLSFNKTSTKFHLFFFTCKWNQIHKAHALWLQETAQDVLILFMFSLTLIYIYIYHLFLIKKKMSSTHLYHCIDVGTSHSILYRENLLSAGLLKEVVCPEIEVILLYISCTMCYIWILHPLVH